METTTGFRVYIGLGVWDLGLGSRRCKKPHMLLDGGRRFKTYFQSVVRACAKVMRGINY